MATVDGCCRSLALNDDLNNISNSVLVQEPWPAIRIHDNNHVIVTIMCIALVCNT